MDQDAFWKVIDDARNSVGDVYDVAPAVMTLLKRLSTKEIVSFEQHKSKLMDESYRWDLWAVAYIINGGCSDDGFDYFRAWLLANGRERWESAMNVPGSIGDWASDDGSYEEMAYVAVNAYEAKTGKDFPYDQLTISRPAVPTGESWEEGELHEMYPKLCEKYLDNTLSSPATPTNVSKQTSTGPPVATVADLANSQVDFPRLTPDSPQKCPRWPDDVIAYLRDEWPELGLLDESGLEFLRTAVVEDSDYWVWRFTTEEGENAFVIVCINRVSGQTCTYGDENEHDLSPEQIILGSHQNLI